MTSINIEPYRLRVLKTLRFPVFLVAAVVLSPVYAVTYQLIDLGVDVSPTDINNNGTIVGWRKTSYGNVGFVRPSGGTLQNIPGATSVNAINDSEQLTGNTPTGAFLSNALGSTWIEWPGYGAYDINSSGEICGNMQVANPYRTSPLALDPAVAYESTPANWEWNNLGVASFYSRGTQDGVYADLYTLNSNNDYNFTVGKRSRYGLNGSSSILVEPPFGSVVYLPIPNGGYASAINNNNLVVGATGTNSTTGEYSYAYLYDYNNPTSGVRNLGTLYGGLTSSAADINGSNQVVGTSWLETQLTSVYDPAMYHAFLWENEVDGMKDLNDLPVAGSDGWILTAATAINESGDIVGTGLRNGQVHGFLLSTSSSTSSGTASAPPPTQTTTSNGKGKGKGRK